MLRCYDRLLTCIKKIENKLFNDQQNLGDLGLSQCRTDEVGLLSRIFFCLISSSGKSKEGEAKLR